MRLFLLVALTMCAFAANSVLNRLALADHAIGPASFAAIRLGSGSVVLAMLVYVRQGRALAGLAGQGRGVGAASLALYMLGFSFAYLSLPAGTGALILFGGVQVTMFAAALLRGEAVPGLRWLGAGVAFAGLVWLLWPTGAGVTDPYGAALMAAAAFGWGVYSLNGRRPGEPVATTAGNFIGALPVALIVVLVLPDAVRPSGPGVLLAVFSGVVTSGLGYALWYAVLPRLPATLAAVAQLSVPVLAFGGGLALLGEMPSLRFAVAVALVLGGVGVSLVPPRTRA